MKSIGMKYCPLVLALVLSCNKTSSPLEPLQWTTLDAIRPKGMVSYVGKQIVLKTRVTWHHMAGSFRTQLANDTLWASDIKVNFEHGDLYVRPDLQGQERGNMLLFSNLLSKVLDDSLKEQYASGNQMMDTITAYLLDGSFAFRSWLNVDSAKLADTAFIRQSNDVAYWSQTFQFNLANIVR